MSIKILWVSLNWPAEPVLLFGHSQLTLCKSSHRGAQGVDPFILVVIYLSFALLGNVAKVDSSLISESVSCKTKITFVVSSVREIGGGSNGVYLRQIKIRLRVLNQRPLLSYFLQSWLNRDSFKPGTAKSARPIKRSTLESQLYAKGKGPMLITNFFWYLHFRNFLTEKTSITKEFCSCFY